MHISKKIMLVATAAALTLTAVPAIAATGGVSAGGCVASFWNSGTQDYASSTANGQCGVINVQHRYTYPGGSASTLWTGTSTIYNRTPTQPELSSSRHHYRIYNVLYTYNLGG